MKAIVFDGKQPILAQHYTDPKPDEKNNVLVKVNLAGVCKTDLEILKGYMGFTGIPGHEFVGTVVKGPLKWMDKRVVAKINFACSQCDYCLAGLDNHCQNRSVLGIDKHDGIFAEYVCVPETSLYEVPESVSNDEAVFTEPLAAAFQITRQLDVANKRIAILGDGRLGQLVARVIKLKTSSDKLVLVGKHQFKLDIASKLGISTLLTEDFTATKKYDIVIDATGTPSGFETAIRAVKPLGTIVLKSTFAAESGMNLAQIVIDEITITGSRCGPFEPALRALADGTVEVTDMISKRFELSQGLEALEAAKLPKNIKVLIDVE